MFIHKFQFCVYLNQRRCYYFYAIDIYVEFSSHCHHQFYSSHSFLHISKISSGISTFCLKNIPQYFLQFSPACDKNLCFFLSLYFKFIFKDVFVYYSSLAKISRTPLFPSSRESVRSSPQVHSVPAASARTAKSVSGRWSQMITSLL